MKRLTLLLVLILAGYFGIAQDCGGTIDLIGIGMAGEKEATLTIDDYENVEKIIVEAIHKSTVSPTTITFSSSLPQSEDADAVELKYSGWDNILPWTANVYRAELKPAETVSLSAGDNEIFSFAAYVCRKTSGMASSLEGELFHVFENGDDPLVIDLGVPESDNPRDIKVKFGIAELDADERHAIFRLMAGTEMEEIILWEWDDLSGETRSYTIHEVEFEDVPGNIDHIEMTMISPETSGDGTGDSFVAGVAVVDVPCEYKEYDGYCTYTQGFYGNKGGKTCAGETTPELLARLLGEDLELGEGDYTFIVPADGVQCVLDILPGGGPSAVLEGAYSCEDLGTIATHKQGRIRNTLLAQGITLALNLRNSPDLLEFAIDRDPFVIRQTEDCSDPKSTGIPGTEKEFGFSQEIAGYLGAEATIADLLDLVNHALGGGVIDPLSLSQVAGAAGLVNEAFDECVVVVGKETGTEPEGDDKEDGKDKDDGEDKDDEDKDDGEDGKKGITGISDQDGSHMGIYPNPVTDRFFITLPSGTSQIRSAVIYSISGIPVGYLVIESEPGNENTWEAGVDILTPGIYILRIESDTGSYSQRFGVQ